METLQEEGNTQTHTQTKLLFQVQIEQNNKIET